MKSISSQLAAHLAGEVTSIATCWRCERRDGQVFGFTDHDRDLIVDGLTYEAESGYTATAVQSTETLAVDNLDVEGVFSSNRITEADILAGLWDYAEIRIFQVNWQDLSQGTLKLRKGRLGAISSGKVSFTAELRGLMQNVQQQVGHLYGIACDADLGDDRCKFNLASLQVSGSLTTVTDNRVVFDSTRTEADGYFDFGKITFTSGNNSGLSMEIKRYINATQLIELVLPMPFDLFAGDTYTLVPGCDKSFATCKDKFNNVVNFRGFPSVPGPGRMISGT